MDQEVEYVANISFFKLIYFNWRIIALQYCDCFCYQHESATGVHVPTPHPEPHS